MTGSIHSRLISAVNFVQRFRLRVILGQLRYRRHLVTFFISLNEDINLRLQMECRALYSRPSSRLNEI
jgi:hypothetical protein